MRRLDEFMPRLFRKRLVTVPTVAGAVLILAIFTAPILVWWFAGESFLAVTHRVSPDVLILEAWTGPEGARAASAEFLQSNHHHLVAVGGFTGERWNRMRWSLVEMAEREFSTASIRASSVIPVTTPDTESQRTYWFAIAARDALRDRGITPKSITVFTRGAHARRSRLVFSKVFGPGIDVGVVAWKPPGYGDGPWWRSTVRAQDLLTETVGYFYELILRSGRSLSPNRISAAGGSEPTDAP